MHYWHAPKVPAGTPATATVVIKSNCHRTLNLPVWQVREWEAKANQPDRRIACGTCLAVQEAMDRHPAGSAR